METWNWMQRAIEIAVGGEAWSNTSRSVPVASSAVDAATQSGRTIDLFDWTGVTPSSFSQRTSDCLNSV